MGVHRLISAYLALVALAVAVQFVLYPLYAYDSAGEVIDAARATWDVLNWFMALGLVLMVVTTFKEKKRLDSAASVEIRRWLVATVMFYGTVLLALGFVPNWFAAGWGTGANGTIWHLIDTVLPVVFAVESCRLWRAVSDRRGAR